MGYKTRKCVECGREFLPRHIRENHCGDRCRMTSIKKAREKYLGKRGQVNENQNTK